MKMTVSLSSVLIVMLMFGGCATQRMYYFGNYSETLYHYKKNQDEKSFNRHKQELEKIIAKAETKSCRVPPGICAELGYLNLKTNNEKEAVRLFAMESSLYPESKQLMDRLTQKAQGNKKEQANKKDESDPPSISSSIDENGAAK